MWIALAFGSSLFAALSTILAKCGIKKVDSTVATAIRTVVVLIFSWLMVFIVGSQGGISQIKPFNWLFLIFSGFSTGASWLCYFKALEIGNTSKVVAIDKYSTVLTILLALIIFQETVTKYKIIGILLISVGTFLMLDKTDFKSGTDEKKTWILFATGSAVFASLTSILAKTGITGIESNLGTAIRTVVVLLMSWVMVFVKGKGREVKNIGKKNWLFIILSGVATGGSWLCYFKALQDGPASVVVPIDKLSILFVVAFSFLVFKEKLKTKNLIGLLIITGGTLLMLF